MATNLIFDQATTNRREFQCLNANGTAVSFTGCTLNFFAHLGSDYSGPKIIDLDNASKGGVLLVSGRPVVTLTAPQSIALPLYRAPGISGAEVLSDGTTRYDTGALCQWSLLCNWVNGDTTLLSSGSMIITRR